MKKIALTLFAVVLVIATTLKASAFTEQTRQVSGFNSISGSSSFAIHVNINGTESLKIDADQSIINDIETVVENGTLKIGFKRSFEWHHNVGKVDVYVTAKSLSALSNSGSGSIKVDGGELQGKEAEVHISGSGNITTGVKTEALNVHISGSGSINLSGNANNAEIQISGSGQLRGKELKTEAIKAHLSGSGSAYINADKSISAHISGSGSLMYSGSASITDISTSGSGRVRKG